jgi:DNA recombination-dependent growth factor C
MDPIAAIGSANSNSMGQRAQACSTQGDLANLQDCLPNAQGAHLDLQVPLPPVPAQMNVVGVSQVVSHAMTDGFYAAQVKELMRAAQDPKISNQDKMLALMDISERVELSKLVSKLSAKLAEGIQTVVTKAG